MNTHVNFETAKLLKEKGFDKICEKYYPDDGSLLNVNKGSIRHIAYRIQAPTIAEVCMWLYDKHNLFVAVYWFTMGANEYAFKIVDIYEEEVIKDSFFGAGASYTGGWHTPTEAYQEAINYTLKNLIE